MRVLGAILDAAEIRRLLAHLDERTNERIPSRAWDPVPIDAWTE